MNTRGLTGNENEQVFVEALFCGFDQEKEPMDFSIAQVLRACLKNHES